MTAPVTSPDGKWIWTGSEWIPAPPTSTPTADSTVNLEDSMMSGNVDLEQNSSDASSVINLKDSAMSGDVNITQNNPEDIAKAMMQALENFGFPKNPSPIDLVENLDIEKSVEHLSQVSHVLELSEQLTNLGINIEPQSEISLGLAAYSAEQMDVAQDHFLRALKSLQSIESEELSQESYADKINAMAYLGYIAESRGDLHLAEQLLKEVEILMRQIGGRTLSGGYTLFESEILWSLGNIAKMRADELGASEWYQKSISIKLKLCPGIINHIEKVSVLRDVFDKQIEIGDLLGSSQTRRLLDRVTGANVSVNPKEWQVDYRRDDDGTEWAEDANGAWWFRQTGDSEWSEWTD